jgi:histone H3/H4
MKLQKTALREIMKEQGAAMLSAGGLEAYRLEVERYAAVLAEQIVLTAKHGHRKKIMAEDVELVAKILW